MRRLYVYINNEDDRPRQPLIHEFLKAVFAKDGWEVVMATQHETVSASSADEERRKVQNG